MVLVRVEHSVTYPHVVEPIYITFYLKAYAKGTVLELEYPDFEEYYDITTNWRLVLMFDSEEKARRVLNFFENSADPELLFTELFENVINAYIVEYALVVKSGRLPEKGIVIMDIPDDIFFKVLMLLEMWISCPVRDIDNIDTVSRLRDELDEKLQSIREELKNYVIVMIPEKYPKLTEVPKICPEVCEDVDDPSTCEFENDINCVKKLRKMIKVEGIAAWLSGKLVEGKEAFEKVKHLLPELEYEKLSRLYKRHLQ